MGSRLAAQGTHIDPVPKDEHSNIGSAERAIEEIDRMVAALLLDSNIPSCCCLLSIKISCINYPTHLQNHHFIHEESLIVC